MDMSDIFKKIILPVMVGFFSLAIILGFVFVTRDYEKQLDSLEGDKIQVEQSKEAETLALQTKIDSYKAQIAILETNSVTDRQAYASIQAELYTTENELKEAQDSIVELNTQKATLESDLAEAQAELEEAQANAETDAQTIASLQADVESKQSELADVNFQLETKTTEVETLTNEVQTLTEERDQALADLETKESEIATLNEEIASLESDVATKESEIATLNARIATLEDGLIKDENEMFLADYLSKGFNFFDVSEDYAFASNVGFINVKRNLYLLNKYDYSLDLICEGYQTYHTMFKTDDNRYVLSAGNNGVCVVESDLSTSKTYSLGNKSEQYICKYTMPNGSLVFTNKYGTNTSIDFLFEETSIVVSSENNAFNISCTHAGQYNKFFVGDNTDSGSLYVVDSTTGECSEIYTGASYFYNFEERGQYIKISNDSVSIYYNYLTGEVADSVEGLEKTVTFYIEDQVIGTTTLLGGTKLDTTPTKEGYTITGWKTLDGTSFDTSTPIMEDVNLYAIYESLETKYAVTFKDSSITIAEGEYASDGLVWATAPTYTGYEFAGWYCDGVMYDGTETITLTKDMTFYAEYQKKELVESWEMSGYGEYNGLTYGTGYNYAVGDKLLLIGTGILYDGSSREFDFEMYLEEDTAGTTNVYVEELGDFTLVLEGSYENCRNFLLVEIDETPKNLNFNVYKVTYLYDYMTNGIPLDTPDDIVTDEGPGSTGGVVIDPGLGGLF